MSDTISRAAAEEAILTAFEKKMAEELRDETRWGELKQWLTAYRHAERRADLDRSVGIAMRVLRDLPAKEAP